MIPGVSVEKKEQAARPYVKTKDDEEIDRIIQQLKVNIKIIGCGGGGSNTINRCVSSGVSGALKCAVNTDVRHLYSIKADRKIVLGYSVTRGHGTGAQISVGEQAVRESENELRNFLAGTHIAFITAGLGGGTGTAAAPFIAKLAKESGALTIGVVTIPFKAEGAQRAEIANYGLEKLRECCDTTIVVPNDKLLEIVPNLTVEDAFRIADEVLMESIRGITEIVTKEGLVSLDYSDIKTVMKDAGIAHIGLGESTGKDDKVEEAVNDALTSPLLDVFDFQNAKQVLIRVVGGPDMTVSEAERAVSLISKRVSKDANIVWGCAVEPELEGKLKVLVIIAGGR
jgi:cell division protein FtsZ